MERELVCECGYVVRSGDVDDLVTDARHHARDAHGMAFTREQVLALARPVSPAQKEMTK